jgi:dolichyl-phosphate-mannose-protein mannosyltransferase
MPFMAGIIIASCAAYATRETAGWVTRYDTADMAGSDIRAYIRWTRRTTLDGIQELYQRTPTEPPAVYGPVVLYSYQAVGLAYRRLVDPDFDLTRASQRGSWLVLALKVVAVTWHFLTALVIFVLLRQMADRNSPLPGVTAGAYAANPAAVFAAAHWAQPDGAYCVFVVLAVGWLTVGRLLPSWTAMAVAALAKPQAWVLVPFIAFATVQRWGRRGLICGLAVGLCASLVVILPFVADGSPSAILAFPEVVASVDPVISGNAHNLWWIVAAVNRSSPTEMLDATPALGQLTYRMVAAILVLGVFTFTSWLYNSRRAGLVEAAALWALGWFVFTTGAHENHLSLALALLALAWPSRRSLVPVYAFVTVTMFLNLALHDQNLMQQLGLGGDDLPQLVARTALRTLNAVANVLCFFGWAISAARRTPMRAARWSMAARSQRSGAAAPARTSSEMRPGQGEPGQVAGSADPGA